MKLSKLGEFGLIRKLQKQCSGSLSGVLAGIGDDAAVVKSTHKKTLITSDMLIEGVHFDLSFTTFSQLGHKFLAVNVSDIFAMGGSPEYFLISMGIPETCDSDDIHNLYSGINKLAGTYHISVVGGDTCTSKKGLVLSGTLIGSAKNIIYRSGAQIGDSIFVTGALGDSSMGLALLRQSRTDVKKFPSPAARLRLVKKHVTPLPAPLKSTTKVTSMIDVSDGLLADLSHICDESRTGAVIYEENIPLSKELASTASRMGIDPVQMALKGGEDYVLLFTAPPGYRTKAHRIGEITKKGRYIIDGKGKKSAFKAEGYEHFK